jgi:hypothetical protein
LFPRLLGDLFECGHCRQVVATSSSSEFLGGRRPSVLPAK